ncbi:flavin reductase family protein [Microbispora sp. RL4-1S]|uniref:Flavin reductase family protein n=1 Tax=Microbispora oryzae TaxID=2806554 RepID=A0A940WM53_9ACTN|nr:flavin reductase family protein [Microbispora oryzae]MBP2708170.1 flavin reductase family protein [Microbispora oryzae]
MNSGMKTVTGRRPAREALGSFASGVVVVTASGPGGPLGFTCQSFTSLSLDPLLVSLAVARTSRTWPRIREVGDFCVNVLAEDQRELSAMFAGPEAGRFAGVRWRPGLGGAPILDGVCAWISCQIWSEHDGGDHTIIVGRVTALDAAPSPAPLLFHRGRYGALAKTGG